METDESLIKQCCRQADKEAFSILVERYQQKIFNLTYRLVSDRDDAADITQEVFYRAFLRLNHFRGDASFATWLYRIATNACYDHLRARKSQPTTSLDDLGHNEYFHQVPDTKPGPEDICISHAMMDQLQQTLKTLPLEQRTILVLRDIQGLSYDEIAQVLQCSLGTVKSRLSRSRKAMRDKLMSDREHIFSEHVYSG